MLDEGELTGDRDEGGAAGRAWLPQAMLRELLWLYLLWLYLLWLYLLWLYYSLWRACVPSHVE